MIYRQCGRCGKRVEVGKRCECTKAKHKNKPMTNKGSTPMETSYPKVKAETDNEKLRQYKYDVYKRDKASVAFYSSDSWRRLRETAKSFYNGIDIYSYYIKNKLEYGREVHHIRPIKQYPELKDKLSNLILLTAENHQRIHAMMEEGKDERIFKMLDGLVDKWLAERTN